MQNTCFPICFVKEESMGLDSLELIIRIEDTFGIQISDRVAAGLTTPRKVTDFILSQVQESKDPLSSCRKKLLLAAP
jgi:hypothetical protein